MGEDGYAYRARVAARLRTQPELREISEFFTSELTAQLADARGATTAKLDAPVNKLARLLNSPSIKRILLNDSLRISFDQIVSGCEVLVVKGALGAMGAGNTSVLMQLLVGMLDAALARQQDGVPEPRRVAVALKVDEAPLVLNRGFAETMALKRSAGLETVACWQTDSQWTDRDVRAQLDALFAHRVYFATASVQDSREAAKLTMAAFSDVVRPDIRNLAALGHPDVRLHLPRHHAIASWVTPEGRQLPFVARTIPMRVDEARLAYHAARQAERGGRYLDDLAQPHWNRPRDREPSGSGTLAPPAPVQPVPSPLSHAPDQPNSATASAGAGRSTPAQPPSTPADSFRELVDAGFANRVRRAAPPAVPRRLDPDALDLEILALVASLRHLLSSQIHRRFNPTRAATTTQRRLKRLADAGLVERLQLHRRDGGGTPMCYSIATAGLELLAARGPSWAKEVGVRPTGIGMAGQLAGGERLAGKSGTGIDLKDACPGADRLLQRVRYDIRAAGWALALERALALAPLTLLGPDLAPISPPARDTPQGPRALGPADLSLPEGRTPHDFLRTVDAAQRVDVQRFDTVRPDVAVRAAGGRELLVELDDRLPDGPGAAKLERYDHFLSGWSAHVKRYTRPGASLPLVVFVCRDRPRARECARRADGVLVACRAYAGEHPRDWSYPGRARILFAAERDVHEGLLHAWGVAPLPPSVRAQLAGGDPRSRDPVLQAREIELGGEAL